MILRYDAVHNDDLSLNINTFLCYKSIPLQYVIKKIENLWTDQMFRSTCQSWERQHGRETVTGDS